jgi:hypothetical protein
MRWSVTHVDKPKGLRRNYAYIFHDLVDDDDEVLGWVREDVVNRRYSPMGNNPTGSLPEQPTLDEAKAILIAHFVALRLDDT